MNEHLQTLITLTDAPINLQRRPLNIIQLTSVICSGIFVVRHSPYLIF